MSNKHLLATISCNLIWSCWVRQTVVHDGNSFSGTSPSRDNDRPPHFASWVSLTVSADPCHITFNPYLVLGGLSAQVRRFARRARATPRVFVKHQDLSPGAISDLGVVVGSLVAAPWAVSVGTCSNQTRLCPFGVCKRPGRSEEDPSKEHVPVNHGSLKHNSHTPVSSKPQGVVSGFTCHGCVSCMSVADGAGVTSFKLSMRTHFLSNLTSPDGAGSSCQQVALFQNSSPYS